MKIHLKKSSQVQKSLKPDPQFAHLNITQINHGFHRRNRNKEDL